MDEAQEPRSRGRRWRGRLLAAGLALLLSFVALEIGARIVFGSPLAERLPILTIQADPYTGWRMVPGVEHYTYQHPVQVNALGLRGPEVLPKAPGERRVFALGDSLIYGQGVADDQTVCAHLEAMLNERVGGDTSRWTVVNGGHRAYSTHQELGLLEDLGPRIQPDVVVVFWFWNDIKERDVDGTNERLSASGPIAFDTGVAMEGLAVWKWRMREAARRSALIMTAYDMWRGRGASPPADWQVDQALERWDKYLARFEALAERDGFELVVAVVPDANMLVTPPSGPHFTHAISKRAEDIARARELPVCDLLTGLSDLAQAERALPILPYDGHYTGAGNRAIAASVADCLAPR